MDVTELKWRKASRSTSNGGNCVELAALPRTVAARDSKNPLGGTLLFSVAEIDAFMRDVRRGRYDL